MRDAFLDSTAVIGLVFRNAAERARCQAAVPPGGRAVCSRYVAFEIARGFLRNLIDLHNYSFEFTTFSDLHEAARSGQRRFKPYRRDTWLGAFSDYFAALENADGEVADALALEEFRAKLRGWIRRGWRRMEQDFKSFNEIGCREDLPPPTLRGDQRIDQRLPDAECGRPEACRLQTFIVARRPQFETVTAGLESLPDAQNDRETVSRIDGLRHLLAIPKGRTFEGKRCHRCGDAMICLEAPPDHLIVTKNRRHFEPLTQILGKRLAVIEYSQK